MRGARADARRASSRSSGVSAASPPSAANSATPRHADEDRIDRHRADRRVRRLLAGRHLVERQQLQHALAGAGQPGGERLDVADVADAPARGRRAGEQRDEQARAAAAGRASSWHGSTAAIEVPQDARRCRRRTTPRGGSRLTTRNDSRGKSKKYPGCTSTPSSSAGAATRSSSDSSDGTCSTAYQPPSLRSTRQRGTRGRRRAAAYGSSPRRVPRSARGRRAPRSSSSARRELHRRRHRQIGVADQLEPLERRVDRARSGPPTAIQPSFTCGSPTDFDSPPSANDSTSPRVGDAAGAARRARLELVVGEHFVGDDRDAARPRRSPRADRARRAVTNEPVGLFGLTTSTRARPRRQRALDAGEVDRPARRGSRGRRDARVDQIEPRQVIEQRIARPRHEHLVAGVARAA